jgi:predicted nuclease of predicted toxin-antitoxin system
MWIQMPPLSKAEIAQFNSSTWRRARFLIDENIDPEIACWIRRSKRWHADHVSEVGLAGKDDKAVFAHASKHGQWLLTHDDDFLNDRRFPLYRNHGLVVLPGGDGNHAARNEALWDVLGIVGHFDTLFPHAKIAIAPGRIWTIREHLKAEGRHLRRRLRFDVNGTVLEWVDEG